MNIDVNKAIAIVGVWGGAGLICLGKDPITNITLATFAFVATIIVCGAISINWTWTKKTPETPVAPPVAPPKTEL